MPYVLRDDNGQVVALSEVPLEEDAEELDSDDSEVLAFLTRATDSAMTIQGDRFLASDLAFIRVIEDVIEALIRKGVLTLADLPPAAQDKLMERRALRGWLAGVAGIVEDDG
ncbi:MAG TPA: hypothetical protein VLL76_00050 [Candidatus Omnitrophota bacterium]|nr:hypothetical protein [Candidatus Omnitrophota bacterium]